MSVLNCSINGTNVTSATMATSVAVNYNGSSVVVGLTGWYGNQVVQYGADGSVQWSACTFGSSGLQPVAVNQSNGDVYFTVSGSSIVLRYSSSGVPQPSYNNSFPLGQPALAIALDGPRSLLYAVVPYSLFIGKWSTAAPGTVAQSYLPPSNSYIALSAPVAVAIVPGKNGTVAAAGFTGLTLLSFNGPPAVLTTMQLLTSGQFAVDGSGNYYIPSWSSINEFSQQIQPVQQFSVSRRPGLSSPLAVAVDSQGNVFVADTSNNRIVQFTASGYPQLVLTGSDPQLYAPQALQLFNGSLYAVDANGRLLQFAPSTGQQTAVIIDTGGDLVNPVSLAIDTAGRFYIADAFLQRVTQHSSTGQLLAVLTNSSSLITRPSSVAVDSVNSLLYIVDQAGYPSSAVYAIQIPTAQPLTRSPSW